MSALKPVFVLSKYLVAARCVVSSTWLFLAYHFSRSEKDAWDWVFDREKENRKIDLCAFYFLVGDAFDKNNNYRVCMTFDVFGDQFPDLYRREKLLGKIIFSAKKISRKDILAKLDENK